MGTFYGAVLLDQLPQYIERAFFIAPSFLKVKPILSFLSGNKLGNLIFEKLALWWDADKKYLLEAEKPKAIGNVPEEFRSRFSHLRKILGEILALNSFWETSPETGKTIKRIITEMADHGIPTNNLKLSFLKLFPEFVAKLEQEIEDSLATNKPRAATDAYNLIIDLTVREHIRGLLAGRFELLLNLVVQQIKWRNFPILVNAMHTIGMVLSNCPQELTTQHQADILFGLKHLLIETLETGSYTLDELLVFRQRAARLASRLFRYFMRNNMDIPDVLKEWQTAMMKDDEFDEILIEWEEFIPIYN
ncbi:MAG: hypothetical protein EOO07_39255 [Chitinophagaceae bacterium]|nr:MAG: hypothetical protein EOO07_39255 [Chitinophagaceae bacterium]